MCVGGVLRPACGNCQHMDKDKVHDAWELKGKQVNHLTYFYCNEWQDYMDPNEEECQHHQANTGWEVEMLKQLIKEREAAP